MKKWPFYVKVVDTVLYQPVQPIFTIPVRALVLECNYFVSIYIPAVSVDFGRTGRYKKKKFIYIYI